MKYINIIFVFLSLCFFGACANDSDSRGNKNINNELITRDSINGKGGAVKDTVGMTSNGNDTAGAPDSSGYSHSPLNSQAARSGRVRSDSLK